MVRDERPRERTARMGIIIGVSTSMKPRASSASRRKRNRPVRSWNTARERSFTMRST
jgi:hypothetical protein